MKITKPSTKKEIKILMKLWLQNFKEDNKKYVKFFFKSFFSKDRCLLLKSDSDEIISCLQYRIFEIKTHIEIYKVPLIIGIITVEKYRGQGYMRQILDYALKNDLKEYKDIYIQAYNWEIYKSFGFQPTYFRQKISIDMDNFKKASLNNFNYSESPKRLWNPLKGTDKLFSIYEAFCKNKNGYALRDHNYFYDFINETNSLNKKIFATNRAYMVLNSKEKKIDELAYFEFEDLENLFKKVNLTGAYYYNASQAEHELLSSNNIEKISVIEQTQSLNKLNCSQDSKFNFENLYFNEA